MRDCTLLILIALWINSIFYEPVAGTDVTYLKLKGVAFHSSVPRSIPKYKGISLFCEEPVIHRFEYEFKVLEKLVEYEGSIKSLNTQLQEIREEIKARQPSVVSTVYTRWGRSSCPSGAIVVYEGVAAGSHYTHSGAATNYICLPRTPIWDPRTENPNSHSLIYGAEYETHGSYLHNLQNQDVPCAVCRVPRSHTLLVPGRNDCHQNYTLEYSGYLMSGHYTHTAATEYVCVDNHAEPASCSSPDDENGKLFYFVQVECGSLKCPPYEKGKQLTCAVCSF